MSNILSHLQYLNDTELAQLRQLPTLSDNEIASYAASLRGLGAAVIVDDSAVFVSEVGARDGVVFVRDGLLEAHLAAALASLAEYRQLTA